MSKKIVILLCLALLLGDNSLQVGEGRHGADFMARRTPIGLHQGTLHTLNPRSSPEGILQWSQTYGAKGDDWGYALLPTTAGGYALAGTTFSNETGDYDFWLGKTDAQGELQWEQLYGTYKDDWAYAAIQTMDGGYALVGTTYSGAAGLGQWDAWLVKTDAQGELQWEQLYGTPDDDEAYALLQTADGGYALAGTTFDPETEDYDAWLVKTDSYGDQQWEQFYGSYTDDEVSVVLQTADGGYALAGTTFDPETEDYDAWLIKTDIGGEVQWDQLYGTPVDDRIYAALQTGDGGYVLAGTTFDPETDDYDFWLVKLNARGEVQWNQTYGTAADDEAYALLQTGDGGYMLGGYTDATGTGVWDAWLVKTDASGEVEWTQAYGDEADNWAEALLPAADGSYVVLGTTGDPETGEYDVWLAKAMVPPETSPVPEMRVGVPTVLLMAAVVAVGVWKKRQ